MGCAVSGIAPHLTSMVGATVSQRHDILCELINSKNMTGLLEYLNSDGSIELLNIKRHKGITALHEAAMNGDPGVVLSLIQHGASVNILSNYGYTSLYFASQFGNVQIVKILLYNGANANLKTTLSGWTPLHVSTKNDHNDVMKMLLMSGVDANQRDNDGRSPLHFACYAGLTEAVSMLLSFGADPNLRDNNGETPTKFSERENVHIKSMMQKALIYRSRRSFMMFLANYQFFHCPREGYPREGPIEKVFAMRDLHRYVMTFL
jgi:ankyrin repeat protein